MGNEYYIIKVLDCKLEIVLLFEKVKENIVNILCYELVGVEYLMLMCNMVIFVYENVGLLEEVVKVVGVEV